MPDLEWNVQTWDKDYQWDNAGDEWSRAWGSPVNQWNWTIRPRLDSFLPAGNVLEIGPGYGRWTQYLMQNCRELFLVDISPNCIDACRKRFAGCNNIRYHVNDGSSLSFLDDASIDLTFSFDSLVHAERDVLEGYLEQLSLKLARDGAAFIHHSNLGSFPYFRFLRKIERLFKPPGSIYSGSLRDDDNRTAGIGKQLLQLVAAALIRLRITDRTHMRAESVSATIFRSIAEVHGLSCISQEIITWGSSRRPIDCLSVLVRKGSRLDKPYQCVENTDFMRQAELIKRIAGIYSLSH